MEGDLDAGWPKTMTNVHFNIIYLAPTICQIIHIIFTISEQNRFWGPFCKLRPKILDFHDQKTTDMTET